MKRLLILCAGLASLLALASVQADTPLGASTTGVNHTFAGVRDQHSSFTVKDYGADALDTGSISYHDYTDDFHYNADVACVRVFNGNQAKFAFQIPPGVPDAGFWQLYVVTDGGEPGTNGDELGTFFVSDGTFVCSLVNGGFTGAPNQTITAGNIQVR